MTAVASAPVVYIVSMRVQWMDRGGTEQTMLARHAVIHLLTWQAIGAAVPI